MASKDRAGPWVAFVLGAAAVILIAVLYLARLGASPPRRLALSLHAPTPAGQPNPQPVPAPAPRPSG